MFRRVSKLISIVVVLCVVLCSVAPTGATYTDDLYSFVLSVYGKDYTDLDVVVQRLNMLQNEYATAILNNFQVKSFEELKSYAEEIEEEMNLEIDYKVNEARLEQEAIVRKIELGVESLSPNELATLVKQYEQYELDIASMESDRSSVSELFSTPMFEEVDIDALAAAIEENSQVLSEMSVVLNTYLGAKDEFKLPVESSEVITEFSSKHPGVDYKVPIGTDVSAMFFGVVTRASDEGDIYGKCVQVNSGNGFVVVYANLSDINVKVGDVVMQNEVIGKSGDSGDATTGQLHIGLLYEEEFLDVRDLFM